jgi:hypothetical protein
LQEKEEKNAADVSPDRGQEPDRVEEIRFKQKSSSVWTHFHTPMLYNGQKKAKCKLCDKLISAVNTTNLRTHMNSVHKAAVKEDLLASGKVSPAQLVLF